MIGKRSEESVIGSVDCCPICGSDGVSSHRSLTDRVHAVPGQWDISRCSSQSCDCVWLDPRPADDTLLDFYKTYDTHANPRTVQRIPDWYPGPLSRIERKRRKVHRLPKDIQRPSNLFEIGCGNGVNLLAMLNIGCAVAGFDFDPAARAAARMSGLTVFDSLAQAISKNKTFEVVLLAHVIEHVSDLVETLEAAKHLLAAGGKLCVYTPNIESFSAKLFKSKWRGIEAPRHLQLLGPEAMQKLLASNGFENINIATCYGSDGFLASRSVFPLKRTRTITLLAAALSIAVQTCSDVLSPFAPLRGGELVATAQTSKS
jgi:SAM-dependent methyltransferase